MESLFKGVLLSKSIGTIRFVPLLEMTEDDWRTLDFEYIRDVAKNRIAEQIVERDLVGFFQVNIVEKAVGKERYYMPATEQQAEKFARAETIEADDIGFGSIAEVDDLSPIAKTIVDQHSTMSIWPPATALLAVEVIREQISKREAEELELKSKELNESDLALLYLTYLYKYSSLAEVENFVEETDELE
jgi:hypothetical protein